MLPTPGSSAAASRRLAAVRRSGPMRSVSPSGVVRIAPSRALGGESRPVCGDRVGDQQHVVEAVDRARGARRQHPDHPAQHRADEARAAGPAGLVDAGSRRGLVRPRSGTSCATSVRSSSPVPSSSDSVSVAISGRPRPSPGESARGTMPRPSSRTTSSAPGPRAQPGSPSALRHRGTRGSTTFVHASVTASLMSESSLLGHRERLAEPSEGVADDRDVLGAGGE